MDWVGDNRDRIDRTASLPYWIMDNSKFLGL